MFSFKHWKPFFDLWNCGVLSLNKVVGFKQPPAARACSRARLRQHGGAAGRAAGFQETRAGEKTSGQGETNGNNKAGDGGKSKHWNSARSGNEIIEEPPRGRGLRARWACLGGVTCGSEVAATARPLVGDRTFWSFWWRRAQEQMFGLLEELWRRSRDSSSDF